MSQAQIEAFKHSYALFGNIQHRDEMGGTASTTKPMFPDKAGHAEHSFFTPEGLLMARGALGRLKTYSEQGLTLNLPGRQVAFPGLAVGLIQGLYGQKDSSVNFESEAVRQSTRMLYATVLANPGDLPVLRYSFAIAGGNGLSVAVIEVGKFVELFQEFTGIVNDTWRIAPSLKLLKDQVRYVPGYEKVLMRHFDGNNDLGKPDLAQLHAKLSKDEIKQSPQVTNIFYNFALQSAPGSAYELLRDRVALDSWVFAERSQELAESDALDDKRNRLARLNLVLNLFKLDAMAPNRFRGVHDKGYEVLCIGRSFVDSLYDGVIEALAYFATADRLPASIKKKRDPYLHFSFSEEANQDRLDNLAAAASMAILRPGATDSGLQETVFNRVRGLARSSHWFYNHDLKNDPLIDFN